MSETNVLEHLVKSETSTAYYIGTASLVSTDLEEIFEDQRYRASAIWLFMSLCRGILRHFQVDSIKTMESSCAVISYRLWKFENVLSNDEASSSNLERLATRITCLEASDQAFSEFYRVMQSCLHAGIPIPGALDTYNQPELRQAFLGDGVLSSSAFTDLVMCDQYPSDFVL